VPVYQITGLAKGQTVAEILEDYPSLTHDQVTFAVLPTSGAEGFGCLIHSSGACPFKARLEIVTV